MAVVVKDDESTGAGRGSQVELQLPRQSYLKVEPPCLLAELACLHSRTRGCMLPRRRYALSHAVSYSSGARDKFGYGSTSSTLMQSIIYRAKRLYVARNEKYVAYY